MWSGDRARSGSGRYVQLRPAEGRRNLREKKTCLLQLPESGYYSYRRTGSGQPNMMHVPLRWIGVGVLILALALLTRVAYTPCYRSN